MACHAQTGTLNPVSLLTKNGQLLPLELWRMVFSYLPVKDLCRCCYVCKIWSDLVNSLDSTYWKDLYLNNPAWRHPSWPRFLDEEPKSWKRTYSHHHVTSRIWLQAFHASLQANCLGGVFQAKLDCKTLDVGFEYRHKNLKSALAVADDYDTIVLHGPCVYDEQFEMTSRIPLEIVGSGQLGSVVLCFSMELFAPTTRLSNLVLKAPWFTTHIVKMTEGHLLVENCIFEEGQVIINSPSKCHIRYSIFNNASVSLKHLSVSLIESCEFSNIDGAAITVDATPRASSLWSTNHLQKLVYGIKRAVLDVVPPGTSLQAVSQQTVTMNDETPTGELYHESLSHVEGVLSENEENYFSDVGTDQQYAYLQGSDSSELELDTDDPGDSSDMASETSSMADSTHVLELSYHRQQLKQTTCKLADSADIEAGWLKEGHLSFIQDNTVAGLVAATQGVVISGCRIVECKGGLMVANQAHCHMYNCELIHLQYGVRCLQNAKVILIKNDINNCKTSGVFMRLGASGLIADNEISSNGEAGIDIRKDANPVIKCNRIYNGKRSGIVVLGQGQGVICGNDIHHNQEAGIYVLYNGNPIIRENHVHHGQAAGIAINEKGQGLIIDNLISCNRWGGIDVRHSGDPTIKGNVIIKGLADGIVIGKDGSAAVENNTVMSNSGCGVWVMSGIKPFLHDNQISNNGDHGIAFVKSREVRHSMEGAIADFHAQDQPLDDSDMLEDRVETQPIHRNIEAVVSHNQIFRNSGSGINVQGNEPVYIHDNTVHANQNTGVIINQSFHVKLDNNNITCNNGQATSVEDGAKVEISNNGMYSNSGHGILCKGDAKVEQNDIVDNGMSAVYAEGCGMIRIHHNRLSSLKNKVIQIRGSATAHIYDNLIKYMSPDAIDVGVEAVQSTTSGDNEVILAIEKDNTGFLYQDWKLEDPPARPHFKETLRVSRQFLVHNVISVAQVKISSSSNCQGGSKLCTLL